MRAAPSAYPGHRCPPPPPMTQIFHHLSSHPLPVPSTTATFSTTSSSWTATLPRSVDFLLVVVTGRTWGIPCVGGIQTACSLPGPATQIYGDGVYGHLAGLARESNLCLDLVDSQLLAPFRHVLCRTAPPPSHLLATGRDGGIPSWRGGVSAPAD